MQHSYLFTAADGTVIDYDCVLILSLANQDGELRVIEAKDFSDPEKRKARQVEVVKIMT